MISSHKVESKITAVVKAIFEKSEKLNHSATLLCRTYNECLISIVSSDANSTGRYYVSFINTLAAINMPDSRGFYVSRVKIDGLLYLPSELEVFIMCKWECRDDRIDECVT